MTTGVTTMEKRGARASRLPEAVLLFVTLIWGVSFLTIQTGMTVSGPLMFQALRYGIATLCLALITGRGMFRVTALEAWVGLFTGLAVALANGLQAIGLQYIPSSTSAFLTALYVPMVPIAQLLFMREMPKPMAWLGILFAFTGMALLAGPSEILRLAIGPGEIMTLASAAVIAAEIVAIGAFTRRMDSRRVAFVQILVITVSTFAATVPAGESLPDPSWLLLATAGGLGLGSVIIHLAMYWAQKRLSPTRATLIYATEPVWAGIVGRVAGERLGLLGVLGACLIVAGVVISGLRRGGGDPKGAAAETTPIPPDH
ncbi:DMT family transporter [Zavarzinia compransoris]|uniref:DMT family transporter n=1 Tax=Zavarzinia marina TaxID=2911065 RepID=UPI001F3E6CB0|nr:DMT family transporter [Zavarzinia marina]MCF4164328.1 DMT family transporter [Zavarzinia marina]